MTLWTLGFLSCKKWCLRNILQPMNGTWTVWTSGPDSACHKVRSSSKKDNFINHTNKTCANKENRCKFKLIFSWFFFFCLPFCTECCQMICACLKPNPQKRPILEYNGNAKAKYRTCNIEADITCCLHLNELQHFMPVQQLKWLKSTQLSLKPHQTCNKLFTTPQFGKSPQFVQFVNSFLVIDSLAWSSVAWEEPGLFQHTWEDSWWRVSLPFKTPVSFYSWHL